VGGLVFSSCVGAIQWVNVNVTPSGVSAAAFPLTHLADGRPEVQRLNVTYRPAAFYDWLRRRKRVGGDLAKVVFDFVW